MTTRISKAPATVATVTARVDSVEVKSAGRAPIVVAATMDYKHPERLATALRGFLADAFVAGRDSLKAEIDMMNEPLKGME